MQSICMFMLFVIVGCCVPVNHHPDPMCQRNYQLCDPHHPYKK